MHLQITNIATIRPSQKIQDENFDLCMSVSLRQTMQTLTYVFLSA